MRITRLAAAGATAGLLVLGAGAPAFANPHPPTNHPPIKHFPCKPGHPRPDHPKPELPKADQPKAEVAQPDAVRTIRPRPPKHDFPWKHCKPTPKPTPTPTVMVTKTPIPIPSGPIDTGDGSSLNRGNPVPLIAGGTAVLLLGTGVGVLALRRRAGGESS